MATDPDIQKIVRAVEDATTFPVLTQNVGTQTGPAAGGLIPAGTSSLGSLVRNTLHEVLQWRPSATDVKGLKSALLVSFKAQEMSGRTVYSHVPRSYIMQVQSDGGAVTGAQASIHTRAKTAVDQSLPLLEGLYPLNTDSDTEDLAAAKATIRVALTGLVEELARPGGPRLQRVDTIFELLLGQNIVKNPASQFDVAEVGGQLGLLRDRLGLELQRINNSEEEKNLTNFLILVDYVYTLCLSWTSLRGFFDRVGNDIFLGPQLVQISRALRVVSESVRETYDALDSVFVGPAEREILLLNFPKNGLPDEPPLTLGDLLEWVDSFASTEGPRLILEAGKDGVIAFRSTAKRLSRLLHKALDILGTRSNSSSPGAQTNRVIAAVEATSIYMDQVVTLVSPFSRLPQPKLKGVAPQVVETDDTVQLQIKGTNFDPSAEVELTLEGEVIEADAVDFVSPTMLFARFDLDSEDAIPGDWTVVVRNSDGIESELPDALKIKEAPVVAGDPPEIFTHTPLEIEAGDTDVPMDITGKAFSVNADVSFTGPEGSAGVTRSDITREGHSRLSFDVDVADDAALGTWTVTVTNPEDKQTDEATFQVVKPPDVEPILRIDSVDPDSMALDERREVVITGAGFEDGMSANFGDKIQTKLSGTRVISSTEMRVDTWVRPGADPGKRTIKVLSEDRKRKASFDDFTVKPQQTVSI